MTYQDTLDYLYAQLPMYHRVGAAAYKADLKPTEALMEALGHPERKFRSIHVAGTNGKGSVSHFLASILQEADLKVGLYTSPHLIDFRERIRLNGEMIDQQAVVDFVERHRPTMEQLHLSFFEMTVGLAFDWFARRQVDVAVIEVGMGGRLDSTNVITPMLSIITNIGLDHTQFLGDTLEKIAHEKAGIIKSGVPIVIGETQPETAPIFLATAQERGCHIVFADQQRTIDNVETYTHELTGDYQKKNIATVLAAVDELHQTGNGGDWQPHIDDGAVQRGLSKVVTNTHLHGRWETIGDCPLTVCETAHNAPGVKSMIAKVGTLEVHKVHLVYGCVNDKDFGEILHLLKSEITAMGLQLQWYFTQPSVPRRKPVDQLVAAAKAMGIEGKSYPLAADALAAARHEAQPNELVLVTGSIFLVADILAPLPAHQQPHSNSCAQ